MFIYQIIWFDKSHSEPITLRKIATGEWSVPFPLRCKYNWVLLNTLYILFNPRPFIIFYAFTDFSVSFDSHNDADADANPPSPIAAIFVTLYLLDICPYVCLNFIANIIVLFVSAFLEETQNTVSIVSVLDFCFCEI